MSVVRSFRFPILTGRSSISSRICQKSCGEQWVCIENADISSKLSFRIHSEFTFLYRTAIALRGKDGVVFAVEKLVTSKLYEPGTNKRLFTVDRHVGMVN